MMKLKGKKTKRIQLKEKKIKRWNFLNAKISHALKTLSEPSCGRTPQCLQVLCC